MSNVVVNTVKKYPNIVKRQLESSTRKVEKILLSRDKIKKKKTTLISKESQFNKELAKLKTTYNAKPSDNIIKLMTALEKRIETNSTALEQLKAKSEEVLDELSVEQDYLRDIKKDYAFVEKSLERIHQLALKKAENAVIELYKEDVKKMSLKARIHLLHDIPKTLSAIAIYIKENKHASLAEAAEAYKRLSSHEADVYAQRAVDMKEEINTQLDDIPRRVTARGLALKEFFSTVGPVDGFEGAQIHNREFNAKWAAMSDAEKLPYVETAKKHNESVDSRLYSFEALARILMEKKPTRAATQLFSETYKKAMIEKLEHKDFVLPLKL